MDPMTIARNNITPTNRLPATGDTENRLSDLVKQTSGKKNPGKGVYDQPLYNIDVSRYSEFLGVLTTLSWIMRDMGYEIRYLTQSGMTYSDQELPLYNHLYTESGTRVVALVAIGNHVTYRFSRDRTGLRLRKFDDHSEAIAPMRDGNITGTKRMSPATVREIAKFAARRTDFDLTGPEGVRSFGRYVRLTANQPRTHQTARTRLRMEFRKH